MKNRGLPKVKLRSEPVILHRIRVTRASADIVLPTLSMIDSIIASGREIRILLADRHYQYKEQNRWALQLLLRGIWQMFQLRKEQIQAHRIIRDITMWAGFPLCPAMDLDTLVNRTPPPLPNSRSPKHELEKRYRDLEAYNKETDSFLHMFGVRHGQPKQNKDGTLSQTWKICPVRCGEAGCAMYDAIYDDSGLLLTDDDSTKRNATTVSIARRNKLKTVRGSWEPDPGHPDDRSKDTPNPTSACHQESITLPLDETLKLDQPFVPGSSQHRKIEKLRTYVESVFGIFKNTVRGNLNRESLRMHCGLPVRNIHAAVLAATTNIDAQRTYYGVTRILPKGIPHNHFMFTDDPPTFGILALSTWGRAAITALQPLKQKAGYRTVYDLVGHTHDCEPPIVEPLSLPKNQRLRTATTKTHGKRGCGHGTPGCKQLLMQDTNLTNLETRYGQRTNRSDAA